MDDAVFALQSGCGHNIRKLLAYIRALLQLSLAWLNAAVNENSPRKPCHAFCPATI